MRPGYRLPPLMFDADRARRPRPGQPDGATLGRPGPRPRRRARPAAHRIGAAPQGPAPRPRPRRPVAPGFRVPDHAGADDRACAKPSPPTASCASPTPGPTAPPASGSSTRSGWSSGARPGPSAPGANCAAIFRSFASTALPAWPPSMRISTATACSARYLHAAQQQDDCDGARIDTIRSAQTRKSCQNPAPDLSESARRPMSTSDANHCLDCGACCAFFRVSFYWAEARPGAFLPT